MQQLIDSMRIYDDCAVEVIWSDLGPSIYYMCIKGRGIWFRQFCLWMHMAREGSQHYYHLSNYSLLLIYVTVIVSSKLFDSPCVIGLSCGCVSWGLPNLCNLSFNKQYLTWQKVCAQNKSLIMTPLLELNPQLSVKYRWDNHFAIKLSILVLSVSFFITV